MDTPFDKVLIYLFRDGSNQDLKKCNYFDFSDVGVSDIVVG